MKEISEKMQLMIFDLLEGNLTKEQSAEVLKQIQQNKELMDFYISFQQTYLKPESIEFENKSSLLKSEPSKLRVWLWTGAAAASIALVLYFIPIDTQIPHKSKTNPTIAKSISPTKSSNTEIAPIISSEQAIVENVTIPHPHLTKKALGSSKKQNLEFVKNEEPIQPVKKISFDSTIKVNHEKTGLAIIEKSKPSKSETEVTLAKYSSNGKNTTYEGEQKQLRNTWFKEMIQLIKDGNLPELKFRKSTAVSSANSELKLMVCTENAAYNSYIYSENE